MKRTLRLFAVALLTLLVWVSPSDAQVSVAVRSAHAKAHQSPNSSSPTVANLHRGESFMVIDDLPYWYEVTLKNGHPAYVAKSACTVVGADDNEPQSDLPPPPTQSSQPGPPPAPLAACTPTTVPANWSVCPADGSGGKYAQAYVQKNRLDIACSYSPMSLADMLALQSLPNAVRALPDSDARLQYLKATEAKTVVVEAYLAMAKDGGQEGVNCGSSTRLDTHMELVDNDTQDPKTNRTTHVIAEVTPWFREAIPAWSTQALGSYASYVGSYGAGQPAHPPTKVRVYGFLFFDEAHATDASSWRGTAWEVHPITRIEVFDNGAWKEIK